jgi:hypothetical protein
VPDAKPRIHPLERLADLPRGVPDVRDDRLVLHSFPAGSTTALCGAQLQQHTGRIVTPENVDEIECHICRARERNIIHPTGQAA